MDLHLHDSIVFAYIFLINIVEPPQYPEPYRKEGEYGFFSDTGRADEPPAPAVAVGSTRIRSKSINVHALVDESEDPLEILEAYFNSTVMNLTLPSPSISQPINPDASTSQSVINPLHISPLTTGPTSPAHISPSHDSTHTDTHTQAYIGSEQV